MEKVKSFKYRPLKPLLLYLEDIQELMHMLSEFSSGDVTFEAGEYKTSNPNEISSLPVPIFHEGTISCDKPHILIHFSPSYVTINFGVFYGKYDHAIQGLICRLEDILLSRRRKLVSLLTLTPIVCVFSGFFGLLSGILPFSIALFFIRKTSLLLLSNVLIILLWVFCLFLLKLSSYYSNKAFSTLLPKPRAELPSFWQRNKDQLIVSVIVGLICSFIAFTAGFLTQSIITFKHFRFFFKQKSSS